MTLMNNTAAAALAGLLLTATVVQAQDAAPETGDMPMAEGHMQSGEMSGAMDMEGMKNMEGMEGMEGMMPMMKMMAQMGPMMEACTEMMQTMNGHMNSAEPEADNG
ncbi:hypothetical protein D6850_10980 [Roseovarius spongiae]|uniref:Pentapeptide MXKDX repeat protein n=1 Tax=Roseovarius spongiae TaxID=2320272 RepID=A0A3A8BA20_9RHOB|nr:hypothetical protein [Roseovarius spongiae]RKF15335.1 hypothetical protein D6850_10980 [Roseovarius spongiae]